MRISFGVNSMIKLHTVDRRLQAVVLRAADDTAVDFSVVQGKRSQEEQDRLYAQGRTEPGPIVTWVHQSNHLSGRAVDLCPYVNGALDWDTMDNFIKVKEAMFKAAASLGIKIRWGGDWDQDDNIHEHGETDNPHFELAA